MEIKLILKRILTTVFLLFIMVGQSIGSNATCLDDGTIVQEIDMLVISTNSPTVSVKTILIISSEKVMLEEPANGVSNYTLSIKSIMDQPFTVCVELSNGEIMEHSF